MYYQIPKGTTAVQGIPIGRINNLESRVKALESGSTVSGVSSIVAGTNVTISPVGGTGAVTINATGSGGSGDQVATGTVNGSNTSFTFATAPSVIVADFVIMRKTESVSGTTNWSGTTTVTMTTAPTDHIYAIG